MNKINMAKLLDQCSQLIVDHGPNSEEVEKFIEKYKHIDSEFIIFADLCKRLRKAFLSSEEVWCNGK